MDRPKLKILSQTRPQSRPRDNSRDRQFMETSKTRPPALSSLRRQTKVVMPQAKFGASREVKDSIGFGLNI